MNKYNMYILFMCIFHLLIWVVVAFGGFFSNKILFINMFIILPMIYIVQTMSLHPITKEKIKYIITHIDKFKEPTAFTSYCYNKIDKNDIKSLQKELGYTEEEILKALLIMRDYEDCLGVSKIITILYRQFCESYRNPFDAQGFIVISYILNSFIFLYKNNSFVLKQFNY